MLRTAALSENLGYSSLWATESRFTRDALTRASALSATSVRTSVGTAVVNPFTRSIAVLATSAATIDEISDGRFILGLGPGTQKYIEPQGIRLEKPVKRLEECALLIRRLWKGETVTFHGETTNVSNMKLDFKPLRTKIPIYFGVTGEKGIELALRVSDGIILNGYTSTSYVEDVCRRSGLQGGAEIPILANVMVCMDDDSEIAIRAAKSAVYAYITSFPAIAKANRISEEQVKQLNSLETKYGMEQALEKLDDHLVREVVAAGTPEECRKRVTDYMQQRVTEVLLTPVFGDHSSIVREIAELLA
jgi:alkanesulfonate monooxygenase SsuD/methylene tetrahydromethanopterin reductase-like flavin-dependent oxidoreductase (luciferase family)